MLIAKTLYDPKQLEKAHAQQRRFNTAKNKINKMN